MACGCGGAKNRKTYRVELPGGLKVTKLSEAAATAFAAKHPGSKIVKPSSG